MLLLGVINDSRAQLLQEENFDDLVKSLNSLIPSFRRKPESSIFKEPQVTWTPVFTGVTTFCKPINALEMKT
jgi:hypothetical protein